MARRLLTLLAETPVHAGGAGAEGALDLPVQREAATGLPVIWGQSLKGALRDEARGQNWEIAVFGDAPPSREGNGANGVAEVSPDDPGGELRKGGVAFGDAQLLAFPAATTRHTFAWTTSRLVLSRLGRKAGLLGTAVAADLAGLVASLPPEASTLGGPRWQDTTVIGPFVDEVTSDRSITAVGALLAALVCPNGSEFDYTRTKLTDDLLRLPDDVLSELTTLATDVVARVQLKPDAKTVAHGPFYAEHLPAETVLFAVLAGAEENLAHLAELFDGRPIQLGGAETVGKGVLWCRVHDAASLSDAIAAARSRSTSVGA
ncbi:MAG TPA: type III-B CRISPR module RAMP protein Cmr4 [Pseudonocardiaceae bacterium]|nr:type III-B CRISPR module RAMP protein Cmr4 [Pseudonocardiaceae bacterium]